MFSTISFFKCHELFIILFFDIFLMQRDRHFAKIVLFIYSHSSCRFFFHSVNKRNGGILKYVRSHTSPAKRIFLQTKLCIKHARTTLSQRAHTKRVYNATAYIYMSYSICHFRQTIYIHNTCVCSLLQFQQIIFFLSYSLHVRIWMLATATTDQRRIMLWFAYRTRRKHFLLCTCAAHIAFACVCYNAAWNI